VGSAHGGLGWTLGRRTPLRSFHGRSEQGARQAPMARSGANATPTSRPRSSCHERRSGRPPLARPRGGVTAARGGRRRSVASAHHCRGARAAATRRGRAPDLTRRSARGASPAPARWVVRATRRAPADAP
jgi:hypothetical protein